MDEALRFWVQYAETLLARSRPIEEERALLRRGLDDIEVAALRCDLTGTLREIATLRQRQRAITDEWLGARETRR